MVLLLLLFCLHISCSDNDDSIRKNPFELDDDHAFVKTTTTFNADTLFLSWELTNSEVSFDIYRVELSNPATVITIEKREAGCYFTRLPYNEPVSVTLSLLKGSEVVNSNTVQVKIDGLDRVIAGIITDQGSVTRGMVCTLFHYPMVGVSFLWATLILERLLMDNAQHLTECIAIPILCMIKAK